VKRQVTGNQWIAPCVRSHGDARRLMQTRPTGYARRKRCRSGAPSAWCPPSTTWNGVLGYGPRVAQDRLRVARALGTLPQLTAALAQGELPFSAIRELTRVATPVTEAAWREVATGKNLRQIEEARRRSSAGRSPR